MVVKSSIAIVLMLGLVLGLALSAAPVAPVAADQDDPRLEALFAQLKAAPDTRTAREVEASIWQIWFQSDDAVIGMLMDQGLAAMTRNDLRAALGKFDQIVKITPDFAEGWNKRATVHYLLGNYPESLHDIERTLKLEPRHFGALSGRGLVLLELDQQAGALEAFESALKVYPNLPGAGHNAEALRREIQKHEI
jgi:tetratricopeptide (TPR) repeat protein